MDKDGGRHTGHDQTGLDSDLIDLSGLNLDRLNALDDNALARSLRRLIQESDTQPGQYTQFESAIVPGQ